MHLNKLAYSPTIENRKPGTPKRSELILFVQNSFLIAYHGTQQKTNLIPIQTIANNVEIWSIQGPKL